MTKSGMTTIEVKKINKSRVYGAIYSEHSVTKQDISLQLNMGMNTVTQNIKDLENDGLICRTGYCESTGGRKAQAIEIVRNAKIAIGIFILKRKVIITAVNLLGEIIEKKILEIEFKANDLYYKNLGNEIVRFIQAIESTTEKILGVGIAVQGIILPDGNGIKYGKLIENGELKKEDLMRYIPYECTLIHDSKAAAYVEIWNKHDKSDMMVLLVNKNLGSALIIGGEVHQGKSMYSGTIEHMNIERNGRQCYCGGHGCLEAYCSAESLQKNADGISFDDLFKKIRSGEQKYVDIWTEYLSYLAAAIRNINTVIDCDIVISGFLTPYFTEGDILYLKNELVSEPFFSDRIIDISLGSHGESSPAVGAALPMIREFIQSI